MQTENMRDVYTLVTDHIITHLEKGVIPWRKPWTETGIPQNLISKRPYRGINILLLNALGYEQNLFLTWKQIKTIGASVNKGEKGNFVVFQKMTETTVEKDGKPVVEKKYILRYYKVFNVHQCKDIPEAFMPKEQEVLDTLLECQAVLANMQNPPTIVHKKHEAFYHPAEDYINMPKMKSFERQEAYYGTLFHELMHSTGHQSRVGRKEVFERIKFGSEAYSLEELVAEMGACYLKSYTGIPIALLENNAAYIKGWLEVLKNDTRFIVRAASRAQQGVEYILKTVPEKVQEEELIADVVEG